MKKFSNLVIQEVTSFSANQETNDFDKELKSFKKILSKKPNELKRTVDKKYIELKELYSKLESAKLLDTADFEQYLDWLNQYFHYTTPLSWFELSGVNNMKDWEKRKLTAEKEKSIKSLAANSELHCPIEARLSSFGEMKAHVNLFSKTIDLTLLDKHYSQKNYIHLKSLPQFCRLIYLNSKPDKVLVKKSIYEDLVVNIIESQNFVYYFITQGEKIQTISSFTYGFKLVGMIENPFDLIITFNKDQKGDSMLIRNKKYFISEALIV